MCEWVKAPADAVRRKGKKGNQRRAGGEEKEKERGSVDSVWGSEEPHATGSEDADVQQLLQLLPLVFRLRATACPSC